jgi:Na+/H+ antiporter NhaD/arsenite permease-like protein
MRWPSTFIDDVDSKATVMTALFLAGLVIVVVEDHVNVNKAAIMLMVSAAMWTFLAVGYHGEAGHDELEMELSKGLHDVGSIILFLLPAMGVVESIDHFNGFAVVTFFIGRVTGPRKGLLMPILCALSFFLSAIIDNLTATIVALKILRHLVPHDRHWRHSIGGLIVIAANAGGAWSPVGDVTTTMLWLQHKISVIQTIKWLFLPSLVAGVTPMVGMWWQASREDSARGEQSELSRQASDVIRLARSCSDVSKETKPEVTQARVLVLCLGMVCILMVPILKMWTGLPPYLGMLLALGIVWFVTDTTAFSRLAGMEEESSVCVTDTPRTPAPQNHSPGGGGVIEALHKMDITGLLFFAGVLLAVGALNTAGVLNTYASFLVRICHGSPVLITTLLGVSSAVVDNVPLVEAAIHMFTDTPMDDPLWQLVALAAGTGGSILSVGSIAGVTLMTMEGVGYIWYCKRVSLWAAFGFGLGIATFELERFVVA